MVKKISLIFSIIFLFLTIGLWLIIPNELTLNWATTILFFIVTTLTLAFYWEGFKQSFSPSFLKRLTSESITILMTFFIIGLLSYLTTTLHWQKDISSFNSNTLSDKTLKIIAEVNEPLKIKFFTRKEYWKNWKPFFELFKVQNNNINTEFINIESSQVLIESEEISKENTGVFYYKNKKIKSVLTDELSVANAFLKLLDQQKLHFSFLVGHGELSIEDKDKNGLSYFKSLLEKQGHQVTKFKISTSENLDPNSILIIAGIKSPLLTSEVETLKRFVQKGGRFLIFQGVTFNTNGYQSLNQIFKTYGITLENKLTIDRLASIKGGDASLPVIDKFSENEIITKGFEDRLFFPLASSIAMTDKKVTSLAATAAFPASWAEAKLTNVLDGKAKYDKDDTAGPINLAVKFQDGAIKGAVIASHFFISNQYQNHSPQFNFVLNVVDWLAGQEKMASLNRPTLKLSRIVLGELHLNTIFYGAVIFGPLLLLLTSAGLYWRRRSL